jgi:hypothetical protein
MRCAPPFFGLRASVPIAVACAVALTLLLFQSNWTELATLVGVSAAGLLPWWLAQPGGQRQ